MDGSWTYTDAWVFSAIGGSDPATGSTLAEVIGSADALCHAVPLEEELVRSIGRLVNAGLVAVGGDGDRYWLTARGAELRGRAGDDPLDWIDTIPGGLHETGPPRDRDWVLPDGAFNRAARDYRVG